MTEISEEAQALGGMMGKLSAASFRAISNTVATLARRGTLHPAEAQAILWSLGEAAGGLALGTMKLQAARLMTQRPLKRARPPRRAR